MALDRVMVAAGLGCRQGVPAESVIALLGEAAARSGLRPDVLAIPDFKRDEAGLRLAASRLGLALLHISDAALRAQQPHCVTGNERVRGAVGFASIAEACARAAAGSGAWLALPRISRAGVTCALAVSDNEA